MQQVATLAIISYSRQLAICQTLATLLVHLIKASCAAFSAFQGSSAGNDLCALADISIDESLCFGAAL